VEKNIMAIITLVLFAVMIALALGAWRKRTIRQEAAFSAPLEALEYFGELRSQSKVFYVATTFAANHLERIAAYGLGARGFGQILVFSEGVLVVRNGERPLAIDKASILSVSTNQVAIDKSVESGGLISINWVQDATRLSTHVRIVDSSERGLVLNEIKGFAAGKQVKDATK
jgi:hypothetical protein